MNPRRNAIFPQLPPPETFVSLLRLLIQHGASVHEVFHGRLLTTLNIQRSDYKCQTLEFFRLVIAENYVDFDAIDDQGWCALLSAIRTKGNVIEALKLLVDTGVSISRVMVDGRSALHLASEMADDVKVLEYLYSCGINEVNRQDKWGFTPLHYSVFGGVQHDPRITSEKITFLLKNGANAEKRGMNNAIFDFDRDEVGEVTPFELSKLLSRMFPQFNLDAVS